MKKAIILASAIFVLTACEQSKKGAWTEADMNDCIKDGKENIKEDAELQGVVEMFDLNASEFTKCVCENAEKQYESYTEADKVLSDENNLSEEVFMEVFGDCFGEEYKDMIEGLMDYEDELNYE